MDSLILEGELEAYWEQGWEGRIEYSLHVEGISHPNFLESGQYLTIYNHDGSILWQGILEFVSRRNEQHKLPNGIWSDVKQKGVSYADWVDWFWRKPSLKARLKIQESKMADTISDHPNINKNIHPPIVTLIYMSLAVVMGWIVPIAFPSYWKIVGLGLVVVGLLLAFGAVNEFRKAQTTLDPHGSPKALVSNGIYRFTRNPIYLGFFLIVIGFPLYFESVWGVIAVPLFAMTLSRLVIEKEEAYLEKKFGETYTGYKSRVRRWL